MIDGAKILGVLLIGFSTLDFGLGCAGARARPPSGEGARARAPARSSPQSKVESPQRARVGLLGAEMACAGGPVFAKKNVHLLMVVQVVHVCPPPPKFNVGRRRTRTADQNERFFRRPFRSPMRNANIEIGGSGGSALEDHSLPMNVFFANTGID